MNSLNIYKHLKIQIIVTYHTILLLITPFTVFSQLENEDLKFDHLSINDGLSQSTVFTICQDKYGFMWFGTEDGINRYDGYEFKIFKHSPLNPRSISNSYILKIYRDSKENLWIGTEQGLNMYDYQNETFIRYKFNESGESQLFHNSINSIYESKNKPGVLWIGTKQGLINLDVKTKQFTQYSLPFSEALNQEYYFITTIYEAPSEEGILWIGSQAGLIKYDIEKNEFKPYRKNQDPQSLSNDFVNVILEDSQQNLWIGTTNGLNILNRKTGKFTIFYNDPDNVHSIGHNNIETIYEDSRQNLWIGTWGGGLNLYNRQTSLFQKWLNEPGNPKSISNNYIYSIYEDKLGILWIGTHVSGINKVNLNAKKIIHLYHNPLNTNSLINKSVRAIIIDNTGLMWIGTDNGISCVNTKTNQYTHFQHDPNNPNSLSDNQVRSVYKAKNGIFWFGTRSGGLNKYNPVTKKFKHYKPDITSPDNINNSYVRTILEGDNGILWIGTFEGGLSKFDPKTEKFKNYVYEPNNPNSINENRVNRIIRDKNGMYWVATGNGIAMFNSKTEKFKRYLAEPKNPDALSHLLIMSLFEDHKGMIWIATYGGGLNMLNPETEIFIRYTEEDGLAHNATYGIVEDKDYNLWVSTNNGISIFNPETKEFKNYSTKDGLQDNEFNAGAYYKDKNENIYFGGINGLNIFEPDSIQKSLSVPPIVIHDFQLFNETVIVMDSINKKGVLSKSILETDTIELSYKENIFSFSFAALDYTFPKENEYKYKLENFESNWTKVKSRRFATYTSLPPGEYLFRVKGSNSDGVWNEEGTAIKIIVKPPYWKTWWFRISIIFFLTLTIYLWIRSKIKNIETQKRIFEDKVKERTEDLYEANTRLEENQTDLEVKQEEIITQRDFAQQQKELIEQQNKELENHRNNLDLLVKKRTSELEKEKEKAVKRTIELQKAKEKSEESDRLKSAFLANMSHEIRTPMNAVIGFSSLLNEKDIDEKDREELIIRIEHNSNTLIHLIDDIIDIAKIEAGQLNIFKKECYVNKTLNELFQSYKDKLKIQSDKDLKLNLKLGVEDLNFSIYTDNIRIQQIFINLLNNAIKFTEKGFIEFGYKQNNNSENSTIVFYVKDTGIGLSKSQQKSIFDRFIKVEEDQKKLYRGAGLGLSICKNIVKLLGGSIWVESELNKGSTFYFKIPITESHNSQASQIIEGPNESFNWKNKTILVAEDEDSNFELLEILIKKANANVVRAINGNEVLEIFKSEIDIDLILMDIKMPEMDGLEATKQIRKIDTEIPIIAQTAYAMAGDEKISLETGCNNYISKPIKKLDLMNMINNYLK